MHITELRAHGRRGSIWLLAIGAALCLSLAFAGIAVAQVGTPPDEATKVDEGSMEVTPSGVSTTPPEQGQPSPEQPPTSISDEACKDTPDTCTPSPPAPPVTPVPPETPSTPSTPETPSTPPTPKPETPSVPEQPAVPSVPVQPEQPAVPQQPSTPVVPVAPSPPPASTPPKSTQPKTAPLGPMKEDRSGVKAEQQGGGAPTEQTTVVTGQTGSTAATLPFTGAESLIVGLLGLMALGLGAGLRRAVRTRA
jgi:hypothetical protein